MTALILVVLHFMPRGSNNSKPISKYPSCRP